MRLANLKGRAILITPSGAVDPSFGGQLKLSGGTGCSTPGQWPQMAASPGGGFVILSSGSDPSTAVLLAVDSTGAHETIYELPGLLPNQVAIQPDGKILVAGDTAVPVVADAGVAPTHAFIARYLP